MAITNKTLTRRMPCHTAADAACAACPIIEHTHTDTFPPLLFKLQPPLNTHVQASRKQLGRQAKPLQANSQVASCISTWPGTTKSCIKHKTTTKTIKLERCTKNNRINHAASAVQCLSAAIERRLRAGGARTVGRAGKANLSSAERQVEAKRSAPTSGTVG